MLDTPAHAFAPPQPGYAELSSADRKVQSRFLNMKEV